MAQLNYINATCIVYFPLKIRGSDKSEQYVLSYATIYGHLSIV
jgi:hypothetical protein